MTISPLLLFSLSRWLFPTFGIDSAYWVYPYTHIGVALHTSMLQYSLDVAVPRFGALEPEICLF